MAVSRENHGRALEHTAFFGYHPAMNKRIPLIILSAVLVALTAPMYLTISGFSLMAFDQGFAWQPALFAGSIILASILIPALSLVFAIKFIRKGKTWHGLGLSLVPALVLGIFWLWLSQQSFS